MRAVRRLAQLSFPALKSQPVAGLASARTCDLALADVDIPDRGESIGGM
jgi:hypothetical protein